MDQILVVFTGGTIGSMKTDRQIDVRSSASYELIERYLKLVGNHAPQLETIQPINILSENLLPQDWNALNDIMKARPSAHYAGVIITHGTDTLAYTAAALSYLFHDSPVPIVLIASNYPISDPRSKGVNNLDNAVRFITGTRLPGVYVCFENSRGEVLIHLGTRIRQSSPFTDEYESSYGVPFGYMENGSFVPADHSANPEIGLVRKPRTPSLPGDARFSSEVLHIRPYPGLDYSYFSFTEGARPKAILHDLYHSATASTRMTDQDGRYSILAFIERCKKEQVPVYICPFKEEGDDLYSTSMQMLDAGAIPLRGITVEAALAKLMLAYGTPSIRSAPEAWMNTSHLLFEHIWHR
ncbi:asparaginase [Paenibacillus pinihumi]|uniref:asparaginase n=1 Tax=Paenibacillus pinihumi TaxID=669462 RepID=UPI000425D6D3|nr:asparaginase [Paenibacillus pinihumi]